MEFVVILKGSEDYSFVHVEDYGHVVSYAPRLSQGDHHHFLYLRPDSEFAVLMPIAPHVQSGLMEVTMMVTSQVRCPWG